MIDFGSVHVTPSGDLIEHETNDSCVCSPRLELNKTHGGDMWIYAHSSLDGRELREVDRD